MNEKNFSFPKRKTNLRMAEQNLGGEKQFIVSDEELGTYFRFPEIEFFIFSHLDGKTSLETIKETLEEKFPNVEIPLDFFKAFVADLEKKNLLEGSIQKKKKPNLWQTLFYWRLVSFNPEKMLERLLNPLNFLFHPNAVYLGLFLIFLSLGYAYLHQGEWLQETHALVHGFGLVLLYFSFLVVAFVHETGHSLTCRRYGGKVKEMGFMLIYFAPAFYSNVSDAYFFPKKEERMYVGLAGLYFQFLFAAFATFMWYFAIPGSLFKLACASIIGLNGFTALWNLNPLIKLDGYYVLNDFLEVVNLRARSFHYFKLLFEKFALDLPSAIQELNDISPRLKKIYFWYGLLGISYTTILLFLLFLFLLSIAAKKLTGLGLVLFAGGIAWGAWNSYKRASPEIAKIVETIGKDPALAIKIKSRWEKIAVVVLFLFLIGLIPTRWGISGPCVVRPAVKRALAPLESGVIAKIYKNEGDFIQKGEIFARLDDFDLKQTLIHLWIEEKKDRDTLAYLEAEYGSHLTQAKGELSQAQLALKSHTILSPVVVSSAKSAMEAAKARYVKLHHDWKMLQRGSAPPQIAQIEGELKKAQTQATLAKKDWKRYQALFKQGVVSPKELEEKKANDESASSQVSILQAKLAAEKQNLQVNEKVAFEAYEEALKAYEQALENNAKLQPQKLKEELKNKRQNFYFSKNKEAEIAVARDQLSEVEAQIKAIQEKIARCEIRSPINGIIMTPHVKELQGRKFEKGEPLAWVYEPGKMIVEIKVDELDIPEIPQKPQESLVAIRLPAFPGKTFLGKIRRIIPASQKERSGNSFLVDVEIDSSKPQLLPGMEGTGKIYGKKRPLLWQIVRRPVEYVLWKLWGLF
jgi:putative peptide zinc metalloprotease protein